MPFVCASVVGRSPNRVKKLSTVRMAPPEYGVSLSETEAMSPNPEYTDIVELLDCRRL